MRSPFPSGRATLLAVVGPAFAIMLSLAAHQFEHPKILRVGVQDGIVLLAITYDLNPGRESARARALFDRDTNGTLDEAERAKLEQYLVKTATLWLELDVQGTRVSTNTATVSRTRFDRPAGDTSSIGVSALLRVPAPGEKLEIRVADRVKDKRKHVPVVVDLAGPYRVRLSTQGELDPDARQIRGIRLEHGRDLRLHLRREP